MTRASLLTSGFIKKTISEDEFRRKWPDLVPALAKKDIPIKLSIMLPRSTYDLGTKIARQLEELKQFSLISEPVSATTIEELANRFDSVAQRIENMQQMLIALEQELTEEYKRTFQ